MLMPLVATDEFQALRFRYAPSCPSGIPDLLILSMRDCRDARPSVQDCHSVSFLNISPHCAPFTAPQSRCHAHYGHDIPLWRPLCFAINVFLTTIARLATPRIIYLTVESTRMLVEELQYPTCLLSVTCAHKDMLGLLTPQTFDWSGVAL